MEKKKIKVTVCRELTQVLEIEVEAENQAEADRIAKDLAPNLDFSGTEKEAFYFTDSDGSEACPSAWD